MKTPAYAQAKKITSMSGAKATNKHIVTLQRTQMILIAQGDEASRQAAMVIGMTIRNYRTELGAFYDSEHYPYRAERAEYNRTIAS
jgi:hypothetical protein